MNKLYYALAGKIRYQPIFERLYGISLEGMNIGTGTDLQFSGEVNVFRLMDMLPSDEGDLIMFDVGANVGNYTFKFLNEVYQKFQIYCFEPAHETFQALVKNVADRGNIHVYNFGFGDIDNTVTLYSNEINSGLASVYLRRLDHFDIQLSKKQLIELKTIDGFCSDQAIEKLHFLKLDVEGNEFNVMKGSERMIKDSRVDFIQFEFGGCNIDSRTYFQDFYYLLNPTYRIYRILQDGFRFIEKYNEKQEIFITTNYLCVSRKFDELRS